MKFSIEFPNGKNLNGESPYNNLDSALKDKTIKLAESGISQPQHDPSGFLISLFFFIFGIVYQEIMRRRDRSTRDRNTNDFFVEVEKELQQRKNIDSELSDQEKLGHAVIEVLRRKNIKLKTKGKNKEEKELVQSILKEYGNIVEEEE